MAGRLGHFSKSASVDQRSSIFLQCEYLRFGKSITSRIVCCLARVKTLNDEVFRAGLKYVCKGETFTGWILPILFREALTEPNHAGLTQGRDWEGQTPGVEIGCRFDSLVYCHV